MTLRYGQLTYTSVDGVSSPGGWQIKETSGAITAAEAEYLVSRIQLALSAVEQLPRYPTAEQLQSAPRRLGYRRLSEDTAAYFHYSPAGTDGMGRPGNVFTHVLLDRDASRSEGSPRPIELWRSPGWLTPYGSRAIGAATLSSDVPRPSDAVNARSVIDFACDTRTWRLGTLCGLLDAVAAALDGGAAVVLGTTSCDAAAQWIGAVSFLMSPGTARRLNFCISDCWVELEYLVQAGHHLIAVPRATMDSVPHGVLFIDETKVLWLGECNGEPHRTADGRQIEATAWSAMAQVVLVDPGSAADVVADIDDIASDTTDIDLPPSLPMALSVLNRARWADAAAEAAGIIAAHTHRPGAQHSAARSQGRH